MRQYVNGTVDWDKAVYKGPSREPSAGQKEAYAREMADREKKEERREDRRWRKEVKKIERA